MSIKKTNTITKKYNPSDLRFFIRLFLSWTIFLIQWTLIIILGTTISLSTVGYILFKIGHYVRYLFGYTYPHNIDEIILDMVAGLGTISLSTIVIILAVISIIAIIEEDYRPWLKKQIILKEIMSKNIRKEVNLKDITIVLSKVPEFGDLDYSENNETNSFFQTIPELVTLRNLVKFFNEWFYDSALIFFPYCSLRRYFAGFVSALSILLGVIFLYVHATRFIGTLILPEIILDEKRKPMHWAVHYFFSWFAGFIIELIVWGIGALLYCTIIESCLKEWKKHQLQKQQMLSKIQ